MSAQIKELRPNKKIELKIDDEFKNLIPAITPDERTELKKSILAEGCRDPLVVWNGTLLDGHNRHEICLNLGETFKTVSKEFDNREQAKIWIISNQLSRRNLTPDQTSYLQGERQNLESLEHGGDRKSKCHYDTLKGDTATRLAKEYGVSRRTILRNARFAEAVDKLPPEEKQEILSGESKKTKKEIIREIREKGKLEYPGESSLAEIIKDEPEPTESEKLWNLKRYWKLTSKKDKKIFIIGVYTEIKDWIRKEEKRVKNEIAEIPKRIYRKDLNKDCWKERETHEFKAAYEDFFEEVRKAKKGKWKETSRVVAQKRGQNIIDLINVY